MGRWKTRRVTVMAWLREWRLNVRYQPWRLIPHPCKPRWRDEGGEYACSWCGNSSPKVQRKGQQQAARTRRQFA